MNTYKRILIYSIIQLYYNILQEEAPHWYEHLQEDPDLQVQYQQSYQSKINTKLEK